MDERANEYKIPDSLIDLGVNILADLGNGILIVEADIRLLREQDKNAHLMKPETFRQLSENIKKRNGLESLPFCAYTDKGIEIVSGHHRVRASKEAGLSTIHFMLDITGLSRSQIAAKQIAHNAINGFDDKSTLKEIARLITEVDDMIESYIGKDILNEPEGTLEKLISPVLDYDWQDVRFMFLPHQVNDLDKLLASVDGKVDYLGGASMEQFEKFLNTLSKYQKFSDIRNIGAAIHRMIETTNQMIEDAGFDESQEWVPLSKIFGNAAIPRETADKIKLIIDAMEKEGMIEKNKRWQGIEVIIEQFSTQS